VEEVCLHEQPLVVEQFCHDRDLVVCVVCVVCVGGVVCVVCGAVCVV
jgi:hypothetical protein